MLHNLRQDDRRPARPIQSLVAQFAARRLTWWPEIGIGYYPVEAGHAPYDQDYFDNFDRNATNAARPRADASAGRFRRAALSIGALVDVGIGSGAFIEVRRARGRDNIRLRCQSGRHRVARRAALLVDPHLVSFDAVTLWDVLEHIPDFQSLLANVRKWVFMSLPIFRDVEHVLRSKHFKPDEHCWYFTRDRLGVRHEGMRLYARLRKHGRDRTRP